MNGEKMEIKNIKINLEKAIKEFKEKDNYLIENNASERAMAHRIAVYLEKYFIDYDVDCEYNINIDNSKGLKKIMLLEDELEIYKASRKNKENDEFNIYPDIIVHKRGTNSKNILVIEMKKKNSRSVDNEYDYLKLKKLTEKFEGRDNLVYILGAHLKIVDNLIEIKYFKDGEECENI